MATLHHIYIDTHIYITYVLLFIPFFILLPLFRAGWLAQTLLVLSQYQCDFKKANEVLAQFKKHTFFWLKLWNFNPEETVKTTVFLDESCINKKSE
jgi:hypothetical protein